MTMGQALVKFLDNQYVSFDGKETKFVDGIFTVFGHGIVCGLGQALDENSGSLRVYQGKNEQGMAHVAASFAKQHNRRKIIACSSSIGPGAANMITAAATATVNNIPLLLFPADTFACRQPDPVLQQFEQPYSLSVTTNDAYKPVCRYWDRIVRPEQLMSAMINAMRVLTDTGNTGAVCIALCQDVEGESYDYPEEFFQKRVHKITRIAPAIDEIADIADILKTSKKPLVIAGGGVRYSEAGETLQKFCEKHNIPFAETQNGKSAVLSSHELNVGGVGVTGNLSANLIAKDADVVITDVWASMGQEEEKAIREKAFAGYCVDSDLMSVTNEGCMVLHCLPAHREEEITAKVFEEHADEIFDEAENRMHAQKAVLYYYMKD